MTRETFFRRAVYESVRNCKTTPKSSSVMKFLIGLRLMTALVYLYGTKKLHRVERKGPRVYHSLQELRREQARQMPMWAPQQT